MVENKRKFKKKDFREVLEIAYNLAAKDSNSDNYSYEVVKETAQDMGISKETMDEAIKMMDLNKIKRRKKIRKYSIIFTIVFIISALVGFAIMPKHFKGKVKITMTSAITNDSKPLDHPMQFSILNNRRIYSFLTIYGLTYKPKVTWEFYDEKHQFVDRASLKLKEQSEPYYAWAYCSVSITDNPGMWKVYIYMDKDLIAKKSFLVTMGKTEVTLTSKIDKDKSPVDSLTTFSIAKHKQAICYLHWSHLKGNFKVIWKWFNPSNILYKTDDFEIEAKSGYWAYHTLYLEKNKTPVGKWHVEVFINQKPLLKKTFQVVD